jgi:DNA-directed RNA polymerase subunit D
MDIKKIYEDGDVTKYLIKGTDTTLMNSIRRISTMDVSCLAVDEVTFYENDSPIFDEMLANRLGMIPIKTDIKSYKEGDEVKLVLEKEGPGIVTSKDIKCTDPKIEILDKKIYLTKLKEEGKIKLEMKAVMKKGKEHAKHKPAIIAYNEIITIDNSTVKNASEIIKEAPEGTLEAKAGKLFFADPYNKNIHDQPINILQKHGVKIDFSDNEFVLTIETTGQLTREEIIKTALDELNNRIEEFKKEIEKL